MRRSTIPNIIHHIDSLVLNEVITKFRKENKVIFTVHDSFYVTLNDINFLKKAYYDSLKEIYYLEPYKMILENNKLKESDFLEPTQEDLKDINRINRSIDRLIMKIPPCIEFEPMCQDILK